MIGSEAFYLPEATGTYLATEHTAGPWDPRYQHGGPPGALLTRAVERCLTDSGLVVARFTGELLGPVPREPLQVRAWVDRPGRRVQLVRAELRHRDRLLMTVSAWAVRAAPPELAVDVPPAAAGAPHPMPDELAAWTPVPGTAWDCGFLRATEWRFVTGGYDVPGPAAAWVRPRIPLLPQEPMSPMQRVVLTADSANGISGVLDVETWLFIPPELTVHVMRPPTGEWLHLDAASLVAPACAGLAAGSLSDLHGPVARSAQSLLVTHRVRAS